MFPLTRRQFIAALGTLTLAPLIGWRRTAAQPDSLPIYLTFDDGIETDQAQGLSGPTLDVLDILEERGTLATFFIHGRNTGLEEGGVLARMIAAGHRVGNHLFHQGGALLADRQPPDYLARLFLDTELRIREALKPYPDALATYTAPDYQHVFRRPGGGYDSPNGNRFLMPDGGFWDDFKSDPYLAAYRDYLGWLKGVYDYSGWHVNPLPMNREINTPEEVVWWALHGPFGVDIYRHPDPDKYPGATTQAALDGLIILLHDPDLRVVAALPMLLDELDARGAVYHVLPRPMDLPNRYTVGIDRPLEIVYPPGEGPAAPEIP
jgi:peptidoglycan/xylan/chitin deacetylase (PgdA/CDA1 family)